MKNRYLFIILGLLTSLTSTFSATIVVTNVGTTFSPADITINVGDSVKFEFTSNIHDAVEVNFDIYTANGNTPNGGFSVPNGGGTVVFANAGKFYYVCEPHADKGMKGTITVNNIVTNIISEKSAFKQSFIVYPNPAIDVVNIRFKLTNNDKVNIYLYDVTGKVVQNLNSATYAPGESDQSFNLNENLTAGRYFIRLNSSAGSVTKPLIILKR